MSYLDTDSLFDITMTYFWPLAILFSLPVIRWLMYNEKGNRKIKMFFYGLIISFFNLLILPGNVSLINRMIGQQEIVTIEDEIKEVKEIDSRFYLIISPTYGSKVISLKVKREIGLSIKKGEIFSLQMNRGSLGVLYKK